MPTTLSLPLLRPLAAMLALMFALAAPAALAQDDDPMAVLNEYVGTWTGEGTWSFGRTTKITNIYSAVFDGKHVRALTRVSDDGGPEYLRYETLFSYNAEEETYVYTTIAYDGSVETGTMRLEDDGFHIDVEMPDGQGGTVMLHQFVSRVSDGRYTWRVEMGTPDGRMPMIEAELARSESDEE